MNCFREIKYHANILAVHSNNVTNATSVKLNSNEITFMGKTAKYKAFTVNQDHIEYCSGEIQGLDFLMGVGFFFQTLRKKN